MFQWLPISPRVKVNICTSYGPYHDLWPCPLLLYLVLILCQTHWLLRFSEHTKNIPLRVFALTVPFSLNAVLPDIGMASPLLPPLYLLRPLPPSSSDPTLFPCFLFLCCFNHHLNTIYLLISFVYYLWSPLECKLCGDRNFCLFCSLLYLPMPRPLLAHKWCSIFDE